MILYGKSDPRNPKNRDGLYSIEENLLHCINGIDSDGINDFRRQRNLEEEPIMVVGLAGSLTVIAILWYRYVKRKTKN